MGMFTQQLAPSKLAEKHLFLRQMPSLSVIKSWKQYFIIFAMFCLFDTATRSGSDPMGANLPRPDCWDGRKINGSYPCSCESPILLHASPFIWQMERTTMLIIGLRRDSRAFICRCLGLSWSTQSINMWYSFFKSIHL